MVRVSTTANIWVSTTANGRYDDDNDDQDDVRVSTTANIWMSTTANGRYDDDNDDADDVRVSTTAKIWMSTTAKIWMAPLNQTSHHFANATERKGVH